MNKNTKPYLWTAWVNIAAPHMGFAYKRTINPTLAACTQAICEDLDYMLGAPDCSVCACFSGREVPLKILVITQTPYSKHYVGDRRV